jgi:thioredoxin 1
LNGESIALSKHFFNYSFTHLLNYFLKMIREITDYDFDRVVSEATVPVLVEFWQPGCGGCQALMGQLESVQAEVGERLLILTMNVQENFQIPAELEISSLPALALYHDGEFLRFIGGIGKKDEILKQVRLEARG